MDEPKNFTEIEEMMLYGFDPTNETDVQKFHTTDPRNLGDEPDYSRDSFEFGGPTSQSNVDNQGQ